MICIWVSIWSGEIIRLFLLFYWLFCMLFELRISFEHFSSCTVAARADVYLKIINFHLFECSKKRHKMEIVHRIEIVIKLNRKVNDNDWGKKKRKRQWGNVKEWTELHWSATEQSGIIKYENSQLKNKWNSQRNNKLPHFTVKAYTECVYVTMPWAMSPW